MRSMYLVHLSALPPDNGRHPRSHHFEADAATALIILFCALICALALKAASRCFLLLGGDCLDYLPQQHQHNGNLKAEQGLGTMEVAPTVAYTAGMELAECTICLSEFGEGEGVRVLGRCNHGFHVDCIDKWLCSHTSCPTCRCTCLPTPPEVAGDVHHHS